MILFHTDQKIALIEQKMIGIKITAISTSRKIFIFQQIWKQIEKHVEVNLAVLTIWTALKLTQGNT